MTDRRPLFDPQATSGRFIDPSRPAVVARAPGRIDLMGGIADYSGSLVLQWPIAASAEARAQWNDDSRERVVHVRTTDPAAAHGTPDVKIALGDVLDSYNRVRERFAAASDTHWASYIAGAITVLHHERGVHFERGMRWLISSDVPAGMGVSSSAAIEVAAMQSLLGLLGSDAPVLDGRALALLCQKVENLVAGAPCGVMDQMTAACGRAGSLLALLCRPAELEPPVALPDGLEIFGMTSGVRHAVSGSDYASVRVGAFMGLRILSEVAGPLDYLTCVSPAHWESGLRDLVPESMTGAEFLARYGSTRDDVTQVDPTRRYSVRQPAAHPIYEHARVVRFRELLAHETMSEAVLAELGSLMLASHDSYSACGLGSAGTDALVALVRDAGPGRGLYGAKITGGGSGGTVAVLARRGVRSEVDAIAARYGRETGRPAAVIAGTSDGAWTSGIVRLPPRSA